MKTVLAPAKVNLYLHVTGKRSDGYHLLDSLFVFADKGDVISVESASNFSFTLSGEFGEKLRSEGDNIVVKAVNLLAKELEVSPLVHVNLEKNLPIASGIGGGSSDAAAVLLALMELWGKEIAPEKLKEIALLLGADVPACLEMQAVQVAGIGELITKAPALPKLEMILVNPKKAVSTPEVFKNRKNEFSPSCPFVEDISDFSRFIEELSGRKNDLKNSACFLEPEILNVLETLESLPFSRFAQMSGSGATCFALFETAKEKQDAFLLLKKNHPEWWILETTAQ